MLENLDINKALQTLISLYALSIGHQFYQGYKMSQLDDRVAQQLKGVFDEKAKALLEPLQKDLGLAKAEIATERKLRKEADKALEKYSEKTQDNIRSFMRKTDSRITSISTSIGTLNTSLKGSKIKRPTKVTTPPPKKIGKVLLPNNL